MSFWIAAAALITLTTIAMVAPILRGRAVEAADANDSAVYRAQLVEVDADVERGVLSPLDAQSARAEIGRRLLRTAGEGGSRTAKPPSGRTLVPVALALAIFVPVGATLLYAATGSPGMSDAPLAERQQAGADLASMIEAAEARLAADPADGRGYDVLAPVYLRTGQTDKAISAYRAAIERVGSTPVRQAGLGEALTAEAGGTVTPAARQAFEAALAGDPTLVSARFHLALALSQSGDPGAAQAWADLVADGPADAPWMPVARAAQADAEAAQSGPDAAALANAADMSPQDRRAMIDGMVSGLAARLAENPEDVAGWTRLIGSYSALGLTAERDEATARARQFFAEGSPERATLETYLAGLQPGTEPVAQ